MGVIAYNSIPDNKSDVQGFLNRIGSIHLHSENGVREVHPFHEMPLEKQEQIARLVQVLLRSQSLFTHLQNHRGRYDIVYKEDKKRSFLIIAGKKINLDQSLDFPERNENISDKKEEYSVWKQIQSFSKPSAIGADFLSFVRNSLSTIATAALVNAHSPVSLAVDGFGIGGAIIGGGVGGGIMVLKGIEEIANSKEGEETHLGILKTVSGAGYFGFGVTSLMLRISSTIESAAAFTQAVGTFGINPTLYIMNIGFLLLGAYQLGMAGSFRSDFNQAVEKGGVKAGIDFLYAQLFLTPEEEKSDQAKEILERKRAHFARRTDSEIIETIAPKVAELKHKFDTGSIAENEMLNASHLLDLVSEANYKKIVQATLFILLATLTILSVAALGPTGTFAFCAALAILWLLFDCSATANYTADMFWKLHQSILGFILVSIEGRDEAFMNYLYYLDPTLEAADERIQAQVYLEALTDMDGSCYRLFKKVQAGKTEIGEQFLNMMQEIRHASIDGDINTPEDCINYLSSAMPMVYEFLVSRLPEQDADQTLLLMFQAFLKPEQEGVSNEMKLKYTAMHLLETLYESAVKLEPVLSYFEAVRGRGENKRDMDAQFMRYLYSIDPALQAAPTAKEARIILQAYGESWDPLYSLFIQMRTKSTLYQGFFDLGYDPEFNSLHSLDEMLSYIEANYSGFWDLLQNNYSKIEFQNALDSGLSKWDALHKAFKFAQSTQKSTTRVAKEFRLMMEEIRAASPADDMKDAMPLFHAFLMRRGGEAALQNSERALDLLSVLYSGEITRAAVFDRFTKEQIKALREETEMGLPLLQLGCALEVTFKNISLEKSAYETILHPELLLSEDEAEILKRHREIQTRAAAQYPLVFEEAMKTTSLSEEDMQKCLEYALEKLIPVEIKSEEIMMPRQMALDLDRSPLTEIDGKEYKRDKMSIEEGLLRLREKAAGDERLFLLLAAFYSQTTKNFLLAFLREMERKEVLTGLYIPKSEVSKQRFIQLKDGSFQIEYHFLFTLSPDFKGGETVKLPLTIALHLEKENGQWVCRKPEHSNRIDLDGYSNGAA